MKTGKPVWSPRPDAIAVIETERLLLRAHRSTDFACCVAMWADPQVVRFIGGKPFSAMATWSRMLRYAGLWAFLGYGYWAIEVKATHEFIGELGFADFKREIEPPLDGLPEFGWLIAPAAQRQGYATEAVNAALTWADQHFGEQPTTCIIAPENTTSLRVAHTAGYREFARTTYEGAAVTIFRRSSAAVSMPSS